VGYMRDGRGHPQQDGRLERRSTGQERLDRRPSVNPSALAYPGSNSGPATLSGTAPDLHERGPAPCRRVEARPVPRRCNSYSRHPLAEATEVLALDAIGGELGDLIGGESGPGRWPSPMHTAIFQLSG
jgi:hypothetical protein